MGISIRRTAVAVALGWLVMSLAFIGLPGPHALAQPTGPFRFPQQVIFDGGTTNGVGTSPAAVFNGGFSLPAGAVATINGTFAGANIPLAVTSTGLTLTGSNTYSGANTFSGDVYFKSGRPVADVQAFGAKGDGVTDDSAAFNAAANAVGNGGIIFVPPGQGASNIYCIKSAVVNLGHQGQVLMGSGFGGTTLSACGADTQIVQANARQVVVTTMSIIGSSSLTTTNDAVTVGAQCINCIIDRISSTGGNRALADAGADTLVMRSLFNNSYGSAVVSSGGGYFWRDKIDQAWPVSTPPAGSSFNAWAATTAYAVGTVVSTGGFYIQASVGGTSGATAPTLQPYGTAITDGTVTWKLVGATVYDGLNFSNSSSTFVSDVDLTGSYTSGIRWTGTTANGGEVRDTVIGATITNGVAISLSSGTPENFNFVDLQIANCIQSTSTGINVGTAKSVTILGGTIIACPIGILGGNPSPANWSITGVKISGSTTAAISIGGGATDFEITGNQLGTTTTWGANAIGIKLNAGATDYYVISGNDLKGATTTIQNASAGGPHGIIAFNVGYTPQAAASITVLASPFTYTNTDAFSEQVAIFGGAVSSVTLRGQTFAQGTNVSPILLPGDSVTVTYSTTPGMTKFPE